MVLPSVKVFLCRTDVKIILICTVTGGILQVICFRYIKSHPEFLENKPVAKRRYRLPRFFSPCGGAIIEVTGINFTFIGQVVINFLFEKGLMVDILAVSGIAMSKIPAEAISTYLRDSFPQNLPDLEKERVVLFNLMEKKSIKTTVTKTWNTCLKF